MSRFATLSFLIAFGCARVAPRLSNTTDNSVPDGDPWDSGEDFSDRAVLDFVGFNVESGDAVDWRIAEDMQDIKGEAIWGMTEVQSSDWARTFQEAANDNNKQNFQWVIGTTGWDDALVILWDDERLALVNHWELHDINVGGTARSPLVGHMRSRETGTEFLFMVNHLWRSQADSRRKQAELLNEWGRVQELPVIAVGDYNFDYALDGTYQDPGLNLLTKDGIFKWVVPDDLVKTHCNSSYYEPAILDFVFTVGKAKNWKASSDVLFSDNSYCPDDNWQSDHRPVRGTILLP
jgi:endonuclease/exonuclease/phosphatase family metal-dependent hydrolase